MNATQARANTVAFAAAQKLVVFVIAFLWLASSAYGQIVNGDFSAGATGWTTTAPANSTIVFGGGQMTATSNDSSSGQVSAFASQTFTAPDPGFLSYLLVQYSSTDAADWDWPIMRINGTNFRLANDGSLVASVQNAPGTINNGSTVNNISNFTTLTAGANTIAPGAFSQDSIFGPGIAIWDNIDFQEITQSPGGQTTLENNPVTLAGANAPQIATNGPSSFTVTLSVSNGTIDLGSPGSVTITGGADGSSSVTFTGTPAQINTAMAGLVYTPNLNFNGAETLVYTATGGGITDTDNIPITVIPGTRSIVVTKTADLDTNVPAGVTVTYTYRVTNDGDQVISNISLVDAHAGSGPTPTPDNETLTTDTGTTGDSVDAATNGVWDTLAPGDEVTFTASYVVTQNDVDTLQ